MKSLVIIIFSILLGFGSQALGESEVIYPDADETRIVLPPIPPTPVDPPPIPPVVVVEGEVRTVDKLSSPRLWGKSRPGIVRYGTAGVEEDLCSRNAGTLRYGLSELTVSWGAAANACPAGTWVCSLYDLGGYSVDCDTERPGSDLGDYFNCAGSGTHLESHKHVGWIAGVATDYDGSLPYRGLGENGTHSSFGMPCFSLPVWCCSEHLP